MFGFMNKDDRNKFSAYTLAEMLIVLLIISVVLISIPQATKKLFKVKEVKVYHGRYECYWENNTLKSYYVQERAEGLAPIIEGPNTVAGNKCEFRLPSTYPYIMIHAVGGGGSGGVLSAAAPTISNNSAYYVYYPENDTNWSKWFRKFMDQVMASSSLKSTYHIKDGSAVEKKDYATNMIVREANLAYRKGGAAGKVSSMFFTYIPGTKIVYMYPGKGGNLNTANKNGKSGKDTLVQIVNQGSSCPTSGAGYLSNPCNIINAKGGEGAIVKDGSTVINLMSAIQLLGGRRSDFGVSAYADVKEKESGFYSVIDSINKENYMSTHVPKNAGNGGNGESQYINGSTQGLFIHEFNNYSKNSSFIDGVKWVSVSGRVNPNIYSNGDVNYCSKRTGSPGITVTRSVASHSTACTPNTIMSTPNYYYCSVGDFDRSDFNLACKTGAGAGPCHQYRFNRSGSSYVLSGSGTAGRYSNPQIHVDWANPYNTTMTVKETLSGSMDYISCSNISGYEHDDENGNHYKTPCSSGKMDFSGNTCKAHKGGDGAVVILW